MSRSPLSLILSLGLVGSVLAQGAPRAEPESLPFELDKTHSTVGFSVRHLGISKVRGSFTSFSGEVHADPATGKFSKVVGVVPVDSVDTGNKSRDNHLKADDFFAADKYPEMRLETQTVQWFGERFVAKVDLTIRDVTKSVVFRGELLGRQAGMIFGKKQVRAGYSATGKIDRQDFGLRFNRLAEGVSVVGNEVTIDLEMEVSRPLP